MIRELTRQEFIKFFSHKYPYALLLLVLTAQLLRMLSTALSTPETTLDIVTGPQLWAQGVGIGLRFGVYLLIVIGAMAFSQEFAEGTVKTVLVLPLQRWQWFSAKLLFLVLTSMALLAIIAGLAALVVAFTLGWGDVVREGVVLYSGAEVLRQVLLAIGLTAVFLLPVCAFGQLVGIYFSSSGAAVGTALLAGIVLEAAAGLGGFGKFVFLYHLHRPVAVIEKLGKGLPFTWDVVLSWGIGACLISFVIMCVWQVARLERMDVTN